MDGMFDDPMNGLDFSSLGGGKPATEEEGAAPALPLEEDVIVDDSAITDDEEREEEVINLDNKATAIHQGIPEIEEDEDIVDDEPAGANDFFTALADNGIIALGDDEEIPEDSGEWFVEKAKEKLQSDLDQAIEEYKDGMPEEIKELLNNYEAGMSIADLARSERKIREISSITDEDIADSESIQKDIVRKHLTLLGESEDTIKETLIDYEDSGLLGKMAKRAHGKLVKYEKDQKAYMVQQAKEAEAQRAVQYKEQLATLKNTIDTKDEIIPGVKLNDKQRKELYKGITQFDKSGKNAIARFRDENPDFDLQVAYLATVLKGDFSVLENIATTKATRGLKEKADGLKSTAQKGGKSLKNVDINVMKKALNFKL